MAECPNCEREVKGLFSIDSKGRYDVKYCHYCVLSITNLKGQEELDFVDEVLKDLETLNDK